MPTEAKQAWQKYEQHVRTLGVRVRADVTATDSGKMVFDTVDEHVVRSSAGGVIHESTTSAFKGSDRDPAKKNWQLKVANRRYEFSGRRTAGSDQWSLTEVTRPDVLKALPKDRVTTRDEIEADYLLAAVSCRDVLVSRLLGHPSVQVHRAEKKVIDGREVFEVEVTIDPQKKISGSRVLERCHLTFTPNEHWVLATSVLSGRNGKGGSSTIRSEYRYKPDAAGVPLLAEIQFSLTTDDKAYQTQGKHTYEWLGPTNMKDEAFTLKAFGFPEQLKDIGMSGVSGTVSEELPGTQTDPEKVRSGGWYLPVFFTAIGLVLAGVVARQLIARRRSRVAA